MRGDSDPEECFSTNDNDKVVIYQTGLDLEVVNVGERFRFCFQVLSLLHLIIIACVILVKILRPAQARAVYFILPPILIPLLLVSNLILFFCRFVHSGRVCSGDYLDTKSEPSKGYLLAQGSFIKTYASFLSVAIYFFWCCICFISARKTAQ